ncbi:MAG: hypothetical protein ABEJ65_03110, partial [bacterium]
GYNGKVVLMPAKVRRSVRLDPSINQALEEMAEDLGGYGKTVSRSQLLSMARHHFVRSYRRFREARATEPECSLSDFLLWLEAPNARTGEVVASGPPSD